MIPYTKTNKNNGCIIRIITSWKNSGSIPVDDNNNNNDDDDGDDGNDDDDDNDSNTYSHKEISHNFSTYLCYVC